MFLKTEEELREYDRKIAKEAEEQKRKAILIPIPSSLLLFLGGCGTLIEYILKKPLNFNLKSAKILNSNHYYDYSKAAQSLDFNPRNIQDTITTKLENTKI